jgi:hypothetical protein
VTLSRRKSNVPKKKLSDQVLIELVEKLIAEEPYEFKGYKWAARPQSDYWEALGVSKWTVLDRIKKPPFIRRRATIDGKQVCLLRVGEAAPKDENDYKRIMLSIWRAWRDKHGVSYGTAAQDAAADKAAKIAAKKGQDINEVAEKAKAAVVAKERKEGNCLWGFAKEVMALSGKFGLPKDVEEHLIVGAFKLALNDWPLVASRIKVEAEALPDGKVRYFDYPSITVIRRFWQAVVHAYAESWQSGGEAPLVIWKVLEATDPWKAWPENPLVDEMMAMQNAMSPAMAEMMQAKWALKAAGKPPSVASMVEGLTAKYPSYALAKAVQEAKAAGKNDVAAELLAELQAKYPSCEAVAQAALEAEAAWEAKSQEGA